MLTVVLITIGSLHTTVFYTPLFIIECIIIWEGGDTRTLQSFVDRMFKKIALKRYHFVCNDQLLCALTITITLNKYY